MNTSRTVPRSRRVAATAIAIAHALLFYALPASAGTASGGTPPPYLYNADSLADGAFLRAWLVCGPFPNAPDSDPHGDVWVHGERCQGLFTDYLAGHGGETGVAPAPDRDVIGPDGERRTWSTFTTPNERVFFGDFMSPATNRVAYAACWIDCEDPEDRLVGLGSSDGVRVWVNGAEVFRVHEGRALALDENYFRLPLAAGRNQVLLKVANGLGRGGFALRPVANADALKAVIPRLKDVLRFHYRQTAAGYTVTWGDPTVVGNLEGLEEARVTISTPSGDEAGRLNVRLGHPFFVPYDTYGDQEYTLSGRALWPYRGRVEETGLLYRGDLETEVQELIDGGQPAIPPSRAADAYRHLLDTAQNVLGHSRYGGEPAAYYRLKAGLTQALEHAVAKQKAPANYARLFPEPRNTGVSANRHAEVNTNWILTVADSIFDESLDAALFKSWADRTAAAEAGGGGTVFVLALETDFLATEIPELKGDDSEFRAPADAIRDRVPESPDGYAILVEPDRIIIAGRRARGAFYGMDTLFQLLGHSTTLETATIIDAPAHPSRASVHRLESFDDVFRDTIDELARLRFNKIFLPSSLYPDLEDAEIQPLLKNAFAYCRSRFIDPIPLVETFGDETLAAKIDPNFLEGVYVEEMPVTVDNLRRLHLPYDRIIVNESTTPRIVTEKGYKVLRVDRDFEFESYAPPVIQLKGQAPVQTDETLLVSADFVDFSVDPTAASCPSDTAAWVLTESILKKIDTHLEPTGIHIGQTGAGYLNRDSRCIAREMPNALLLADAVQKGYDIVRNLDDDADVYMWGDQFSPFQRAETLDATRAAEYLPRDIIVLDWWYRGGTGYDRWRVEQGIRFFDQYGLETMGVVRNDPLNIQQFAALNLHFSRRFQGIVHRLGHGPSDGRYLAAQAGWEGATSLGLLPLD